MVDDRSGVLERSSRLTRWSVPNRIEVDRARDCLVWRWGGEGREVSVGPGLLTDFAPLASAPAEQILGYARQWGVLDVCEHGLPRSHRPPPATPGFRALDEGCERLGYQAGLPGWKQEYWEPLESWRQLADRVQTILNAAEALYRNGSLPGDDWQVVAGLGREPIGFGAGGFADAPATGNEWMLGNAVSELLEIGDIRPALAWNNGEGWRLSLRTSGGLASSDLFGALSTQVLYAVARTDGLTTCSACRQAYVPSRRPAEGRRRYCPTCRRSGADKRDASRVYYRRRSLHP